jgi:subtilisin family serine protease
MQVFSITVGLIVFVTVTSTFAGTSKNPGKLAPQETKGVKKTTALHFPPLPKSILEKIKNPAIRHQNTSQKEESLISSDWGLTNIGVSELGSLAKVEDSKTCSDEIVVAIVDTGIDYTHVELQDKIWINDGETGPWEPSAGQAVIAGCHDKSCNGIDDDKNGYADDVVGWDFVNDVPLPYDTHGHGSHIAGIIESTALSGSTKQTCPRISLMPLKYYDNGGAGYNNLTNTVRAIEYAVKMGAQIINYSGGGSDPATAERAAIEMANKKGILLIAAAGNDGRNNDAKPYFPASYGLENIISVASINKLSGLLPSSNFGKTVHLAAPGLQILSTLPEGKIGTMSGTSQATAFVTGAAALLASRQPSYQFDFRKIKMWLFEGAKQVRLNGQKNLVAAGTLSLPGALEARKNFMAPAVASLPLKEVAVRVRSHPEP